MWTYQMPDGDVIEISEAGTVSGSAKWQDAYAEDTQFKTEINDQDYGPVTCGENAMAAAAWARLWGGVPQGDEPPRPDDVVLS